MAKKYYWLKLKDNFFNQREIKKLRKIAGGDTYTIIYLKLQLLTIKNNAVLEYEGTEDDIYEQLALELDEGLDNIKVTLMFLEKNGLLEKISDYEYLLPEVKESIGSETDSAERKRRQRENKNVTLSRNEGTKSQLSHGQVTKCHTEIERELEKEIDTEKDKNISNPNGLLVDEKTPTTPENEKVNKNQNKLPLCPHQKIIDLYHEMLPMCPQVIIWNDTRKAYLRSRWREWPDISYFETLFNTAARSKFLTGRAKNYRGKPFVASLEWLVRSTNFTKVIEGFYDDE